MELLTQVELEKESGALLSLLPRLFMMQFFDIVRIQQQQPSLIPLSRVGSSLEYNIKIYNKISYNSIYYIILDIMLGYLTSGLSNKFSILDEF